VQLVVVLVVGLLLAAALAAGVAWRHGAFARTAELYVIAESGASLAPGTAVRLSGVRIGEVYALELQPDLKVHVRLRVGAEHLESLRADARAVLIREQLRPAVLELDPGKSAQPINSADPRIGFHGRGTLTEIADELRGRLVPILDDLKEVTGMIRARQSDIQAVLANTAATTQDLARTAAEVRALAAGVRVQVATIGVQAQSLLAKGNQSVGQLGTTIEQLNSGLAVVNGALPGLMKKADDTLGNMNAVARDSREIAAAAAQTVPGMLRSAPPLVDDVRDVISGVKRTWPVRNMLSAPAPPELPIESFDATALRERNAR
jgi:phospholipid/cholesterol/gamma-HCH transport system substrate-binding protein